MTDHTADHFPPEPAMPDDVTAEQLASEPAIPALRALRLSTPDSDALVRRIEAAAGGELARRQHVHAARLHDGAVPAGGTRLVVLRSEARADRRSPARDLSPFIARALRPALLAAAAAAVLAVGLSWQSAASGDATGQQLSDASAVQALSLHDPSAQWADQARAPTVDALGRAIGLGGAP